MRNLVIERITEVLIEMPDLQFILNISPDGLHSLSNVELLDLLQEIYEDTDE